MSEQHDFDLATDYCLKCGCSRANAVDGRDWCASKNVIAISHILARNGLGRRLGLFNKSPQKPKSST